jgi:hypothetical protein
VEFEFEHLSAFRLITNANLEGCSTRNLKSFADVFKCQQTPKRRRATRRMLSRLTFRVLGYYHQLVFTAYKNPSKKSWKIESFILSFSKP